MPYQKRYTFFALLTISICILAIYIHRHRHGQTGRVDSILINVAGGLQKHSYYFMRGAKALAEHYLWLVNTKKQNEELELEVLSSRTKIANLQEVELENQRLREALEFRKELAHPLLSANVIAHDVSSDYFGIRVDRGHRDGVVVGMGVVSPRGLVGRIHRVTNFYSDVLTIIDPTSNIDAVIQRSRARGILSGQSKQLSCKLKYVDRLEDVSVNDTVVSSGFGDIFPAGLLIGYVTAVIPNPNGVIQFVSVKSAVDIYRLEEVFLVLPPTESEKTA